MTDEIQCVLAWAISPEGHGRRVYCDVSAFVGNEKVQKREARRKVIRKILRSECSEIIADILIYDPIMKHLEHQLSWAGWHFKTQSIGWDDEEKADG